MAAVLNPLLAFFDKKGFKKVYSRYMDVWIFKVTANI